MRLPAFLASLAVALAASAQPTVAPTGHQSPADEAKAFKLPKGFEAQLVAAEPDIFKPMQSAFDAKGRLWVTVSKEYPWPANGRPGQDKIVVMSDIGPDGKPGKITDFADGLNIPIGILPLPDGKTVLVSSIDPGEKTATACWIWKLTDTDGDGKADKREKLYGPFGIRDTHGMVNSFTLMPDGWVYACHGFSNDSKVKGRDGHEINIQSGHMIRFRPNGNRIEVYSRGQVNPFGMTIDPWFNFYTADCHSMPMTQNIRGAVYESFGKAHDGLGFGPKMLLHDHKSTGLCGLTFYDADHFPKQYRGMMFLGNVVTSRVNLDRIDFKGSSPQAVEQPDFLVSDDPWFRPVDIKLGPDGALYVNDFYNKIIGHYEVPLTHPGRDRTSGRIWRIVWKGEDGKAAAPKFPGDLTKMKQKEVMELLGSKNITVRMLATHELLHRRKSGVQQEAHAEEKIREDELLPYREAHELWVEQAPVDGADEKHKERMRRLDSAHFLDAHEFRIKTAEAEWEREQRGLDRKKQEERELFKLGKGSEQLQRAMLDWMTSVPDAKNIDEVVGIFAGADAQDTHLRHAAKIALRATLIDAAAWRKMEDRKLSAADIRAIAEVAGGTPGREAAEFLAKHLKTLSADASRLPAYIEHATRYGGSWKAVFEFVKTHKPDDQRTTVSLFHAYVRGIQFLGNKFDTPDREFGETLVVAGLKDTDAATQQRCCEIAGAMKMKSAVDAVAALAVRRDRNDAQRSVAFAALFDLDGDRALAVVGKVLNDADEPLPVRERAAAALGNGGSAAQTLLVAAVEKTPARLQTAIALALAGRAESADKLLLAVAAGKASARLLQDRAVLARLNDSRLPKAAERAAELTKGLPSADQKMLELIVKRRDGFAKVKHDLEKGALLYKNNCANCHQIGGQGAKIGPQLDGVGARGLERLLEDILDPSRNVDQALRSTRLDLKDGKSVSGLVLREEGKFIIMADPLGKELRIDRDTVEERRVSLLSPMPANFTETIKAEDFDHLMAYLLSQKVKEK